MTPPKNPINAPTDIFKELTKSFFSSFAPKKLPKSGPIMIPIGEKNNPNIIPINAPLSAYLPPPKYLTPLICIQ